MLQENTNLKIKKLTKEQIIINTDRLTRFKDTENKYLRVFKDLIINNLIEPKFKKSDLDKIDYNTIKNIAQEIINSSLERDKTTSKSNKEINFALKNYENSVFKIDNNAQTLLDNEIDYSAIVKLLPENVPDNLKFLRQLSTNIPEDTIFPVKKIILCEGITEETLLPEFAKLLGFSFSNNGIYIISAGGKNQVVKYYYNYAEILKIPIFILLDNDAKDNLEQIKPKLRNCDKIHLVKSGEFEDLLPESLIIKTLKYTTKNISTTPIDNISEYTSKVAYLTEFYRNRGAHEFKKADFAMAVKENISSPTDISDEIKEIINELNF